MRLLIRLLKLVNLKLSNLLIRLDPPDLSGVEWPPPIKATCEKDLKYTALGGADVRVYLDGRESTVAQLVTISTLSDGTCTGELIELEECGPSLLTTRPMELLLKAANEWGFYAERKVTNVQWVTQDGKYSIDDIFFDRRYTFTGLDSGWIRKR